MSDRIATTCQHSHTVTLRLDEGEWPHPPRWAHLAPWTHVRLSSGYEIDNASDDDGESWVMSNLEEPPAIRAELEAALAAAEASCGGCGCAERLRAEAERYRGWMTEHSDALGQVAKRLKSEPSAYKEWLARRDLVLENQEAFHALARAADFLDAAQDARGSDLSAEDGEA